MRPGRERILTVRPRNGYHVARWNDANLFAVFDVNENAGRVCGRVPRGAYAVARRRQALDGAPTLAQGVSSRALCEGKTCRRPLAVPRWEVAGTKQVFI